MKERGPWRLWSTFLLFLAGNLCNSVVLSQNYDGARGDSGDSNPAPLGFDGVLQRHDGYVKGETPTIPQTSFSCSAQPYNPGLYADTETQCQVYHVCFEDRQESFLCGPGTNFNQRILACDFWYNFDCNETPNFYSVNADIGKVPDKVFSQGARVPQQPQQPRYPQQPAQPPSVGSYPPRVSVPPPAARPSQPPPPPRIQPQEPIYPQIPQEPVEPQPPRVVPQPPRFQPQPPRVQPPPVAYPPPPAPLPQPRPDPPRVSVQPQYPRIPQGSGQPAKRRPPPPQQLTPTQQEEENGYQFDGYNPSRPALPPPPPPRAQPPRHEFPPAISPPRVSRPPLTPPIIRQPEISRPRPAIETRTEYHPDAEFKGSAGYRPPQQPPRLPQPSQPVGSGYPGYPVAQRPISPGPVAQRPISPGPVAQRPVIPRPVAQIPVAPRPVAQIPVVPRPVAQRPVERPSRPAYQPPQTVQQEHVDTEYVPPPPPPRPIEPSRPSTTYVPPPPPPPRVKEPSRPSTPYVPPPPPPPPPVQQEVNVVRPPQTVAQRPTYVPPPVIQRPVDNDYNRPPQSVAQRPTYVPPPVIQRPADNDYNRPQPPISPSVIREQQKPAIPPPSRPQVSVGSRQPQRPKPVFPPASDHPNSNIKGGPGYNQPPPQIPRFEPTRISRPSSPQGGYQVPSQANRPRPVSTGTSSIAVKQTGGKTPTASGQAIYKPPQQERIKKPSEPPRAIYQPPIQVIDHPQVEIKGVAYDPSVPQTPQRVQSPSTSVVGVKRPQATSGHKQPQTQRPRAPVVISRPQPPSFPATNIKTISPVDNQVYEKPQAPAPSRVKQPSISQVQTVSRPNQPRFPTHDVIDHPNANVKGGSGHYERRPQPIAVSRPSSPPSSPSTSYEQKTTSVNLGPGSASGYPSHPSRGDIGSIQQVIKQQVYKPIRTSPPSSIKTVQKITAVKDSSSYQRPPEVNQHTVLINKQSKPDYEAGASYTRGPETYPKPEFGKPHTPVSTPSRLSPNTKQGSPSQNTITRSQNKPSVSAGSVPSVSVGSGSGSDIRPDLPFDQVPGYQPPYQRQVFPHRENPDHPNESIKGSGAYRPPPPAGFQAAASEIEEQKIAPEPEPAASLHGDTGSE